ncbi:MAG: pentapeptide repeat-containing protein, partial [Cyanobacteria bacterium P01_E01_bin.42]
MSSEEIWASKPVKFWNKPLKVDFKDLFKALSKAAIDTTTGQWVALAKDLVDTSVALGLGDDREQVAWLLIYRSLTQAIAHLVESRQALLIPMSETVDSPSDRIDTSLENVSLKIDPEFFRDPTKLPILPPLQGILQEWLRDLVEEPPQARAIANLLPSYFVRALDREWRDREDNYKCLEPLFRETPFTRLDRRKEGWRLYSLWLQEQLEEPMFQEAFGLGAVYVPLRAYYKQETEEQGEETSRSFRGSEDRRYDRVVVDLEEELEKWLQKSDRADSIRILSGGPGSGKSSFAKVFAAHQAERSGFSVLFVPLHQFDPSGDLIDAVGNFVRLDPFLKSNPLDPKDCEFRLLIIFDGLDELASQGKISQEIAQEFVREVWQKVGRWNDDSSRLLRVVISGRELVVQDNKNQLLKSQQILHLLPYFIPKNRHEAEAGERYIDPENKLDRDFRQIWWEKYSEISGLNYPRFPEELNRGNLVELTAQPLLNYLVAFSYSQNKFDFSNNTNLNQIYQSLLRAVYERGYERNRKHAAIPHDMEGKYFIRILEEIALASWHGDGRKTTIKEIEKRCENSGLNSYLSTFEEGAKAGVTRLLMAFYFRQGSGLRDGERTFEFTHKSFGEYLTARRIVRAIERIHKMLKKRDEDIDEGWNRRDALVHWATICGSSSRMSHDLFKLVRDEVQLKDSKFRLHYSRKKLKYPGEIAQRQRTLTSLVNFVILNQMPMERLQPRAETFQQETKYAHHAEEILLAVLNACARVTQEISQVNWAWPQAFGVLLATLQGQRINFENPVILECLGYLNLQNCILIGRDIERANLREANLREANLREANLR